MKLRPAVLGRHVLTLDPSGFAEPLAKRGQQPSIRFGRRPVEVADQRHRLLLSAHSVRSGNRPTQPKEQLPAVHSITSVARARIDGGTFNPNSVAVLRLTTSSNVVGCWTGRSTG